MNKPLKIYNASAGSGKTYTLVQEYLRIVLHHKDVNKFSRIMAMTFTNKAANEMKSRIINSLISLRIPLNEKNEEQVKFLKNTSRNLKLNKEKLIKQADGVLNKLLHNYSGFAIMTIDKFTHKIIRTFARDLNISIDFDVEMDLTSLRKNVTDLLFDQIGRDKELTKLMIDYANSNLNDDKSWNFSRQLYDFSNEIFKEGAIRPIELLRQLKSQDFIEIKKNILLENKKFENLIKSKAVEAIDISRSKGLTIDDFLGKGSSIIGYFNHIKNLNLSKTPSPTLIKNIVDGRLCLEKHPSRTVIDEISDLLINYYNQIQNLMNSAYKEYVLNLEILKNLNNLSLLHHLVELVEDIKEEDNTLLISDFYQKIAEVIANEPVPFIYERLGVKYDHYLLDEFQDTSHLQWINMIPLVFDSVSFGKTNLIVGDGKQAIYRWRNGEVEQFAGLPKKIYNPEKIQSLIDAERKFGQEGELFPLIDNYRSAPEIVSFNNDIFNKLIQGMGDYVTNIYKDVDQNIKKSFKGFVEANYQEGFAVDDQLKYVESVIIEAKKKDFKLNDICVLTRNNKEGSAVARHLTENGIKVISQDSLLIGKDLMVKFIFNLTCAIEFEKNLNYKIKTLEHYSSIIRNQEPNAVLDEMDEQINKKDIIELFANENYTLKSTQDFHNLYEFTESLIDTFNLDITRNPFLQFYLENIHSFEKKNNSSTRDFITWFKEKGKNKSIASPEGSEAVQIMTIHKAKGLQYPIVICPFFDWTMNLQRQMAWIENEGAALPAYFLKMTKNIAISAHGELYEKEKSKFDLDNLNLLYVAFTRPEVALFVAGDSKKRSSISQEWLNKYFSSSHLFKKEENFFRMGEFCNPQLNEETSKSNYPVEFIKQVMNKPNLSFKNSENWDINNLDEKKLFGTNIHKILSEITEVDDLGKVIDNLTTKGIIEEKDTEKLIEHINKLFNNNQFKIYFQGEKTYNEKEIIDSSGHKFIPDKILFNGDLVTIVDFKTGYQKNEHIEQVLKYVSLMKELGHSKVNGEIFYTETMEVIRV